MKGKFSIIFLSLLFTSFTVKAQFFLRKTDKGPYGTYVLYDQLPSLFSNATITINHNSPARKFKYDYTQSQGYFVVATYVEFSKEDIEVLDTYLERGNVIVISTYYLGEEMEKWLNIKIKSPWFENKSNDSILIFDMATSEFARFNMGKGFQTSISKYDSSATDLQVLGKYPDSSVNFISFKKHNGYVVIHTQPYMFTNYHLIKKRTKAYSEIFFSSLPGPINNIVWDEYTKSSGGSGFAALGFVMSNPALRTAFWLAFAGLLMVVFLSFKRRQRIIPALPVLINNTMDMIRTVSDMYFFSRKNEVMVKKKIAYWLEFLRVKYNIFSTQSPEAFWDSVKMRSNIPDEKVATLRTMVERYRNGDERISDQELIKLNQLIDSFYKS